MTPFYYNIEQARTQRACKCIRRCTRETMSIELRRGRKTRFSQRLRALARTINQIQSLISVEKSIAERTLLFLLARHARLTSRLCAQLDPIYIYYYTVAEKSNTGPAAAAAANSESVFPKDGGLCGCIMDAHHRRYGRIVRRDRDEFSSF